MKKIMIAQYIFFLFVITNVAIGTFPACNDYPYNELSMSYCDTSTRMLVVCQSITQPSLFRTYQQDCLLNTEYEERCIDQFGRDGASLRAHCVANAYYRRFPSSQEPTAYCSHDQ